MTCSRCGGDGSQGYYDEGDVRGYVQDDCYHCQTTGQCKTPGCTDCGQDPAPPVYTADELGF